MGHELWKTSCFEIDSLVNLNFEDMQSRKSLNFRFSSMLIIDGL